MIFECKNPSTEITAVERMQWKSGSFDVAPRDYCALAFRISGTAEITANNKLYFVNTNDILYLPQGVSYTAEYSDTEIIVIHFKTLTNDYEPEIYSFANTEEIHRTFLSAHILWQERLPGYHAYVQSCLYKIWGKLCESESIDQMPQVFLNAVSYINANYTNHCLTVEDSCRNAGISATALRILFQKYYQKTPTQYITQLRLEQARNLIACGIPINQAAVQSGFNDVKYFSRVVKKYYACTPRELKSFGR